MVSEPVGPVVSLLTGDAHTSDLLAGVVTSLPRVFTPLAGLHAEGLAASVAVRVLAARHASAQEMLAGWGSPRAFELLELGWTVQQPAATLTVETVSVIFRSHPVLLPLGSVLGDAVEGSGEPLPPRHLRGVASARDASASSLSSGPMPAALPLGPTLRVFLPLRENVPQIIASLGCAQALPPPVFVPEHRAVKAMAATSVEHVPCLRHPLHGRLEGDSFALGEQWEELQLARVPIGVEGFAAFKETATHVFKEVRWLPAHGPRGQADSTTADGGGDVQASSHLLLLDAGRNIALAIPAGHGGAEYEPALISVAGLHGTFTPFQTGAWCCRSRPAM